MAKFRLGVIGPGLWWKLRHEPVLRTLPELFEISAFCASSERARAEVARDYPRAPFVQNYEEFAQRDDIDAVLVLTPIPLNAPVATTALRAGKHVFMEKPLGCSLEEAHNLLAVARECKRQLYVLEQDGFDLRWRAIHDQVQSGVIGEVVSYEMVNHSRFDATSHTGGGYGETAWRRKGDFPLGRLFDGGHHKVTRLAVVFGRPETISASGSKLRPEYGEYDVMSMHFRYASGCTGYFSYAGYLPKQRNYWHIRGTNGLISVEEDNTLTIEPENGPAQTVALPDEDALVTMWRAISATVTSGAPLVYGPEQALLELTTLLRIQESAHNGRSVSMEER